MTHILPELPYAKNALEPHISAKTLEIHHGKHHATYINNLNKLVADTDLESLTLEEVILATYGGDGSKIGIFNNAAQVWNHSFYWNSMKKNGGGKPSGILLDAITRDFGSFEQMISEFKQAALTQFGAGWAWLISDNGKLKIMKTSNAETPITSGFVAILTIDVWEHAYYLDYQNLRASYIDSFFENLVNWDFAAANF